MGADLENPFFVRFYRWNRRTAVRRGENEHRRRLLEGLGGRVVEVGSGDGVNFPFYPAGVDEVIAIEPERTMREGAERAAAEAPVAIDVRAGVAEDLPLEDASVDAAVAALVLCTVPDLEASLRELHRVVRPGGELRFYEHVHADRQPLKGFLEAAESSGVWPAIAGGCHPTRRTGEAIEAAGFAIERCERFRFTGSWLSPPLPYLLGTARRQG